jgi:SPP1 family phage portal protein
MDLINWRIQSAAPMTNEEILAELIEGHRESPERKKALIADRYHHGDQDIKDKDFQTATILDENDQEVDFVNKNRSNMKMQHKFLFSQVEQKIGYICSKEPTISVDDAETTEDGKGNLDYQYQNELSGSTDAKFRKNLLQWIRKASLHGAAWLHEYKDSRGALRQIIIGRDCFIPIYDTVFDQELREGIYYFDLVVREGTNEKIVTKAQWWTDKQVTFYVGDEGEFTLDPDYSVNPAPHFWEVTLTTKKDGVTPVVKKRVPKTWERIPFIELANNNNKLTDLEPVKDLIDAYDLVASKGTNNLMDFNEFYAVIQGFGGDTASAIVKKLEINRAVSVNSQGGHVDMKQLDLQMAGRIDWLKELWKAIHVFGQAVDVTNDQLGNAPSGISLEFQYTLLDLKADNMIIEAENALKEHLAFLTLELNRKEGKDYDSEKVHVTFNKSRITNDKELVDMINESINFVPDRILLAAHPLVHDADQAYKDLMEQREKQAKEQKKVFGTLDREEDADEPGKEE